MLDSSRSQKWFSGVHRRGGARLPPRRGSPHPPEKREGCWELLGKGLGVVKGSRWRSGGGLETGAPGQLLQTHSFLLSRDPFTYSPHHSPLGTMAPSAPRDEWGL